MRTTRRTRLAAVAVAVALGLMAAACGSDDDSGSADTTAAPADTAAATTAAAGGESTTTAATATTEAADDAEWQETLEAAKAEGKVTLYSSQFPDRLQVFADNFKAETGITLEFIRAVDADNNAKLEVEKDIGFVADAWVAASGTLIEPKVAAGDWFVPAVGPNFDQPDYDRDANYREGDFFVVGASAVTFGWNTSLYPPGLADYPDLLDPALAGGRIGLVEPVSPIQVDLYIWMEENFGEDFLTDLAAQEPRIYPGTVPMGQALGAGEIVASPGVLPQTDAKAAGAPVDSGVSPAGIWGTRYFGMILDGGPHPAAAQVLFDYMLSPEGQEAINRDQPAALPDIPGTLGSVADVRLPNPDDLTPEAVAAYQAKWNALFK